MKFNIATVITNNNFETQIFILKKFLKNIKFIELRVDTFYPNYDAIEKVLDKIKNLEVKTILTFRNVLEGGKINLSEHKVVKYIENILSKNYRKIDFLDIELNFKLRKKLIRLAKKFNKKIVFSAHFLNKDELLNITNFKKLFSKTKKLYKNNITKFVLKIDNFDNYWQTLKFLYGTKNLTFFTVGKTSLISRLIGIVINMPMIFVSLSKPVIKSQPDLKTLISNLKKFGYENI